MEINTVLIQGVVSKLAKNIGKNKMLTISNLLTFSFNNNTLNLRTTDGRVIMEGSISIEEEQDLEFSIEGKAFNELINKIDTNTIKLIIKESVLIVKAKGTYEFPITNDIINPPDNIPTRLIGVLDYKDLNNLEKAKSALTNDSVNPEIYGYYITTNYIYTTNNLKLSKIEMNNKLNDSIFVYPLAIDLLVKNCNTAVDVFYENDTILFQTDLFNIYCAEKPKTDIFNTVDSVFITENTEQFKVNTQEFIKALETLSIFTNNDTIYIDFTQDLVHIHSSYDGGSVVDVNILNHNQKDIKTFNKLTCYSISSLLELLKSQEEEISLNINMELDTPMLLLMGTGVYQLIAPMITNG